VTFPETQPVIDTARLVLRPFRLEDAPTVRHLAGDRRVADTTLSIPHPYPEGAAEAWIATHGPRWRAGADAVYAITDRESGAVLGAIGLVVEPAHRRGELGYWIGAPYWGRGYATEAARAMVRLAFDVLGLHRVLARHFSRNPASGHVLRKIGLRHEGRQREHLLRWDRFEDVELYGILAADGDARGSG
jgi:[ribosomal protein S5]-alanine N-acetyltransferase